MMNLNQLPEALGQVEEIVSREAGSSSLFRERTEKKPKLKKKGLSKLLT